MSISNAVRRGGARDRAVRRADGAARASLRTRGSAQSLARVSALACAAVLVLLALGGCERATDARAADARRPYAVQMHLHGSLSEGQGSMRGHVEAARALGGVDVLWWSDHDWRVALHTYQRAFDFESGALDTTIVVPGRRREKKIARGVENEEPCHVAWVARAGSVSRPDARVTVVDAPGGRPGRAGRWTAAAPGAEPRAFSRAFTADRDRARFPLAARVTLRLALFVDEMPAAGARALISCTLSQQPPDNRQGVINFVVGDAEARAARWSADSLRVVDVPIAAPVGEWVDLRLDITREAERLGLGGADNSLREIEVGLETRDGARATITIDDFAIEAEIRGDSLLAWGAAFVGDALAAPRARNVLGADGTLSASDASSASEPGSRGAAPAAADSISQLVGVEISYGAHVNYFGPALALPDFERNPNGFDAAGAVAFAHAAGGLASINHVFGTADEESDSRGSPDERFAAVVGEMFATRCHGADLIEIGYPARGLSIDHFLALWDSLWCAGILIPGNGVSDSHDNTAGWRDGNNFLTWIWARSPSRADLLAGLRAGEIAFGNPALFAGDATFTTSDSHTMGSVVEGARENDRHEFRLTVRGADPSWNAIPVVRGVRGRHIPLAPRDGVAEIEFDAPTPPGTHVRCEVRDATGAVILCTNPIAFVGASPEGVNAARVTHCSR